MIRVGTCSWADESFVKAWYPRWIRSGTDRLRFYTDRFDVVEANSTFYRLPDDDLVERWARTLPEGFTMRVKAFGLMTRHPVKAEALPDDLRDEVAVDRNGRVDRPSREVRGEVFRRFWRRSSRSERPGCSGASSCSSRRTSSPSPPRTSISSGHASSSRSTRCSSSSATRRGSRIRPRR